jgi:hypothetical protein
MTQGARRMEPVESIPVFCRGIRLFNYWVGELYSKWGNGDGSDDRLVRVSEDVLNEIEAAGYTVETTSWGLHNSLIIDQISNGQQKWENTWRLEDLWVPEVYREFWNSLPSGVREVYRRLAKEGIHWDKIYVCLVHDYWDFDGDCTLNYNDESEDYDHKRYIREAFLRNEIEIDEGYLQPTKHLLPLVQRGDIELLEPLSQEELLELESYLVLKKLRGR